MTIAYTPRTETYYILQGEDEEMLRQMRAYADSLKKDGGDAYEEAEAAAADFAKEASERGIKVVLRSLGRKTWRDLIAKHPPRDDDENDKATGVNLDTLPEDLVPLSMASPVFDKDIDRDNFLDALSEAQFGHLGTIAWILNTRTGADPKARLGSAPIPTSGATSN